MRRALTFALALGLGALPANAAEPAPSGTIVGTALTDSRAYEKLNYLSDRIGHRLSGSEALERAVAWAAETLRRDGVEHVWTEAVLVPHWVRGREAARLLAPIERDLVLLGLGGTVGTPPDGLTAEVLVVDGFEQLAAEGEKVRGKIVLFDKTMRPGFDNQSGYGSVARLRVDGPSAAARLGAVGMLIRSLGTADYRLPHTGTLVYAADAPRIPAAALTAEDAARIRRLSEAGDTPVVRLELGAQQLPDAESANVIAEIPGRERPEEIVLIGAHLDSWDVGDGAHDDGAGCVVVMETMRLLRLLDLTPRRTVRAVLFTNEENGLRGGKDYAERHARERHVAAVESDSGGAAPIAFNVTAGAGAVELLQQLVRPLAGIGVTAVHEGGGGADIGPLRDRGVPVIGLAQDPTRYFDYHHTAADTLDKVDPRQLDRNVAAMAWIAWALADHDATLAPPPPKSD
jgi:hypothetical protein